MAMPAPKPKANSKYAQKKPSGMSGIVSAERSAAANKAAKAAGNTPRSQMAVNRAKADLKKKAGKALGKISSENDPMINPSKKVDMAGARAKIAKQRNSRTSSTTKKGK